MQNKENITKRKVIRHPGLRMIYVKPSSINSKVLINVI